MTCPKVLFEVVSKCLMLLNRIAPRRIRVFRDRNSPLDNLDDTNTVDRYRLTP